MVQKKRDMNGKKSCQRRSTEEGAKYEEREREREREKKREMFE